MVIERSLSPEVENTPNPTSANPISLENLDAAQKTQLERFLQQLVVSLSPSSRIGSTNIYRQGGNNRQNTPNRPVKREIKDENGSPLRKKSRVLGKKVTVDLTADSDNEN